MRESMTLSCIDDLGNRIQSFEINDEDWRDLETKNRRERHLRMSCCSAEVVLKRSSRGIQFFAHKHTGPCTTAPESEEHRQLKLLAVEAAIACGWDAQAEVSGSTRGGEEWRADVLATKGNAEVAIEIQWSGQVHEETLRRQRRYRDSGVRGLWLLRQPGFPNTRDLPAVCIGGDLETGFAALLPHSDTNMRALDRRNPSYWRQTMPMVEFLQAAFDRRLKWGTPFEVFGDHTEVEVRAADAVCWSKSCGVVTDIIAGITLRNPGMKLDFSLAEIGNIPRLVSAVLDRLPAAFDGRHIKRRYSQAQGNSYLSNGCSGCDCLFGEYILSHDPQEERKIVRFPIQLAGDWLRLARSHSEIGEIEQQWWVAPPQ